MLKLKTTDRNQAVCSSPKITGIFSKTFPNDIKSNLEYKLEKFCQLNLASTYISELSDQIYSNLNLTYVIFFYSLI